MLVKLKVSKKLTKGRPRPHLQNQSANPEDWLIRDKEGSFIDNDTEDIIRNGCEGWTICENYSSVFILLCNIFRLCMFNGSFLFTISTLKSIIIKQYLQWQQHHNSILSWLRNRCVCLFKSLYTSTICLTTTKAEEVKPLHCDPGEFTKYFKYFSPSLYG